MAYNYRIEMYGLLLKDRDVWVTSRGQRCMAYNQRIEMYGLFLEDRYVWVITRG